jgi:excisionase family DNA binding protein
VNRETMNVEEFAKVTGIGRDLAYLLARNNQLPVRVIRLGRRMVIPRADVEELLGAGQKVAESA